MIFNNQQTGVRLVSRTKTNSIPGVPVTTTETLIYSGLIFIEPEYVTKSTGKVIGTTGQNQSLEYFAYFPKTLTIKIGDHIFFHKADLFKNVLYTNFTTVNGLTTPGTGSLELVVKENPRGALSFDQIEVVANEKPILTA